MRKSDKESIEVWLDWVKNVYGDELRAKAYDIIQRDDTPRIFPPEAVLDRARFELNPRMYDEIDDMTY